MEDSGEREQYSKTGIFERIYRHSTTREQKAFTLNHHHTTTSDNSRLQENMPKPCFQVLPEQNNPDICLGAAKGEVYSSIKQLRFNTLQLFVPNSKRLGGLHSVSALFSPKKRTPLRMFLQRQTASGPQDKKNPNTASELFSTRKSGSLSTKDQEGFKKRSSSSLCQTARGSGATSKWEYFFLQKGAHHAKISQALHGFAQESTRTTLVPARQDLKEQDEASRAQP